MLSILTAHCVKSPPDLNAALTLIRSIRSREAPAVTARPQPVITGSSFLSTSPSPNSSSCLVLVESKVKRSGGEEEDDQKMVGNVGAARRGDDEEDEDLPVMSISAAGQVGESGGGGALSGGGSSSKPATSLSSSSGGVAGGVAPTGGLSSSVASVTLGMHAIAAARPVTLSSEACLKYIIFLADVNRLYDAALAMYDFDLVTLSPASHTTRSLNVSSAFATLRR